MTFGPALREAIAAGYASGEAHDGRAINTYRQAMLMWKLAHDLRLLDASPGIGSPRGGLTVDEARATMASDFVASLGSE